MGKFLDTMSGKTTRKKVDAAEKKAMKPEPKKAPAKPKEKGPKRYKEGSVSVDFWGS